MALADLIVIGGGQSPFASAVPAELAKVNTSAQARAACNAAHRVARDSADEIGSGGGDSWRAYVAKRLSDDMRALDGLRRKYAANSTQAIDRAQWVSDSARIQEVYDLLLSSRREVSDEDAAGLLEMFSDGLDRLATAILEAPGEVVDYAADLGVRAVKGAGTILKSAADVVTDTIDAAIPWRPILLVVGIAALGVIGLVYLKHAGVSVAVPGVLK